jgi:branched-chain amino acid transport system permease protein
VYTIEDLAYLAAVFAVIAYGLQISDLTGRFTMASAAFAGIGAIVRSALEVTYGWGTAAALLAALVAAAAVAVVVAFALVRVRDLYFAVATFAVSLTLVSLGLQVGFAGGVNGILGMPRHLTAISAVAIALIMFVALGVMDCTRWGHRLRAIGDNEVSAAAAGVPVRAYVAVAFVVGAVISALGGWMYADYFGAVTSSDFGFGLLVQVVAIVLIGGKRSYLGTLVGSAIVVIIPRLVSDRVPTLQPTVVYGGILLVVVLLRPEGIVPRLARYLPSPQRLRRSLSDLLARRA